MPILAYTTTIAVEKTAGEIQQILAAHGARRVVVDYDEAGKPAALSFSIKLAYGTARYRLPVNVEGVWKVLTRQQQQGKVERRFATREQAARTAWRILREWVQAQMAIVEAGLAVLDEIMLPYALGPGNKTIYQEMTAERYKLLGSGEEAERG